MIRSQRKTLIASTLACGLLAALQLSPALARNDDTKQHERSSHAEMNHGQMGREHMSDRGSMRNNMDHERNAHAEMNRGQMGRERMSDSGSMHNNMEHERNMQRLHENRGQMDHGNMGQGQPNHGSTPPAKGKGRKHDR